MRRHLCLAGILALSSVVSCAPEDQGPKGPPVGPGAWRGGVGYAAEELPPGAVFSVRASPYASSGVLFSLDGRQLVTAGYGDQLWVWDLDTGRPVHVVHVPEDTRDMLGFADARTVVTLGKRWGVPAGESSVIIRSVDLLSDRTVSSFALPEEVGRDGFPNFAEWVALAPGGRWLAASHEDNVVRVWDLQSQSCAACLPLERRAHVQAITFSHDGRRIACTTFERLVIYDRESTTKCLDVPWTDQSGAAVPTFSADGRLVGVADKKGRCVKVFDTTNGRILATLQGEGKADCLPCLAFSPDGKRLAASFFDPSISIWNLDTGEEVLKPQIPGPTFSFRIAKDRTLAQEFFGANVATLAFSPDGRRLVSRSSDGRVLLWDLGALERK
jgi:WD40 repeat protein